MEEEELDVKSGSARDALEDAREAVSLVGDLIEGLAAAGTQPRARTLRAASRILDDAESQLASVMDEASA